jgi:hypothetical protein
MDDVTMRRLVDLCRNAYEARGSARAFPWERDDAQERRIRDAERALEDAVVKAVSPAVLRGIRILTEQVLSDLGGCDGTPDDPMGGAIGATVYGMYLAAVLAEHERQLGAGR